MSLFLVQALGLDEVIGKGNDCLFPLYLPIEGHDEKLRVGCGHCINCKMKRISEWCMRLEMESKYYNYDDICFVTLTYNDENLPYNIVDASLFLSEKELEEYPDTGFVYIPTLCPEHLRNFIKRLRKCVPEKLRFYGVGEYGTKRGRPHLHLLLFGLKPYHQHYIQEKWKYGFVDVRPFFPETCSYIAGYVQKKLYGKDKVWYKLPEFMRCSQHLGEQWILDHISMFDKDHAYIPWHGYEYAIPRQFRKLLIKKGRLPETSLIETSILQRKEYQELTDDLAAKGVSISDFWSYRLKLARVKQDKKNALRNITGDI